MANEKLSMSKIRQLLRLHTQGKGKRSISELTGISRNSVKKYIKQFEVYRLSFEELNELSNQQLFALFERDAGKQPPPVRYEELQKFFPRVDKELQRTGVTRQLLWEEYLTANPDGYRFTQFCHHYNEWTKRVNPSMHMEHKAGDKMFVDFAGEKLFITDKDTGEMKEVEVFVAILGASQLTFVEATQSQQKEDFISGCENSLHYFLGVPQAIVSDNLKSAVIKSDKYEPTLNETFEDFASHYQTNIMPTRAYKPKDKALVEGAVKIVYTRIYAALRDQLFFSLEELNQAIKNELEEHNNAPLQGRTYSRREKFEAIERAALKPLPQYRYEFKKQAMVTVMKNGHICLTQDKHYYSVPYQYIGKKIKLIYSKTEIEIFYQYERIAHHQRMRSPYNYSTLEEHLASTHKFLSDWRPEKFIAWAENIGQEVKELIFHILEKKQHPEQGYKSCIGILSLAKKYGNEGLINACRRALEYGFYNYKTVQNILEKGLDTMNEDDIEIHSQLEIPMHENIRGQEYYQ